MGERRRNIRVAARRGPWQPREIGDLLAERSGQVRARTLGGAAFVCLLAFAGASPAVAQESDRALRLEVSWTGTSDLDLVVADPSGYAVSVARHRADVTVGESQAEGVLSESLTWLSPHDGSYVVCVVGDAGEATSAHLRVTLAGRSADRTYPLAGVLGRPCARGARGFLLVLTVPSSAPAQPDGSAPSASDVGPLGVVEEIPPAATPEVLAPAPVAGCLPSCAGPYECVARECVAVCAGGCSADARCSAAGRCEPRVSALGPSAPARPRGRRETGRDGGLATSGLAARSRAGPPAPIGGGVAGSATAPDAPSEPAPGGARPLLLSLGLGPSELFSNTFTRWDPYGFSTVRLQGTGFMLSVDVGGHMIPVNEHPGLFLAGSIALMTGPVTGGRLGARLGFDIQVARFEDIDLSLLVTPSILAGLAVVDPIGILIDIEVAADVRALLLDGLLGVWIRPIASDMQFLGYFTWRWNFLLGVDVRL